MESGGAGIGMDAKNGEKGASKFWERNHPSKTKCDINQQLYITKKLNIYISDSENYSSFL